MTFNSIQEGQHDENDQTPTSMDVTEPTPILLPDDKPPESGRACAQCLELFSGWAMLRRIVAKILSVEDIMWSLEIRNDESRENGVITIGSAEAWETGDCGDMWSVVDHLGRIKLPYGSFSGKSTHH